MEDKLRSHDSLDILLSQATRRHHNGVDSLEIESNTVAFWFISHSVSSSEADQSPRACIRRRKVLNEQTPPQAVEETIKIPRSVGHFHNWNDFNRKRVDPWQIGVEAQ
jgi:hypothetical protein